VAARDGVESGYRGEGEDGRDTSLGKSEEGYGSYAEEG